VLARVSGIVRLGKKRRGKRIVWIQPVDELGQSIGSKRAHLVSIKQELLVSTNNYVRAGDPLLAGSPAPRDILRCGGVAAVQNWLLAELLTTFHLRHVRIDDKHLELIIAQMLRKVQIMSAGDTRFVPGALIDKAAFEAENDRLEHCVKIKEGDSRFPPGTLLRHEEFEQERTRCMVEARIPPMVEAPLLATGRLQLLGITKVAAQSGSFLASAATAKTVQALAEAALAGSRDPLAGLKENVLLGRLVPAGTGFTSK
jgi:DNA-directed RNA polymerase subunit beta'